MTKIDPSGIPGADLDLEAVRTGATGIGRNGGVVRDQGAEIVRDWQRMPGVFEATGTESLYTAMTPVGTTTTAIGDSLDGIARALSAYASEVEPIKARLDSLRSQATSFVAKTNSFHSHTEWVSSGYTLGIPHPQQIDSWDQDPDLNDENNSLIRQVAEAEADWLDAQQRCATAIRAAVGLGAKGAAEEQAAAKQLRGDDLQQTPWGSTSDRKESCSEKATTFPTHFLWDGVIVGFGWGTIKSLNTLSGLNPDAVWKAGDGILHGDWGQVVEAGKEDFEATTQAWLGLTHLVSSLAIPVNPALRMQLLQSGAFDWLPPDVRQGAEDWTAADGTALYGTVAGFVGLTLPRKWWDPKAYKADQVFQNWTENPGGAAGNSVANIASFFIPGAGEAKAAGIAGDAAKVAEGTRVADMLADGSIGTLRGLSADALKATIKGLSDADAAKLATELAKPELDAGALSGLKLDDLTIHEPVHLGGGGADAPAGGAHQPGAPDESAASRTDGANDPARSPEPPADRHGESEGGAGAAPSDDLDDAARRATGSSTSAHDLDQALREPALVGAERQSAAAEHAAADHPAAPDPIAPSSAERAADDGGPEVRNEAGPQSDPIETTRTGDPTPQHESSPEHEPSHGSGATGAGDGAAPREASQVGDGSAARDVTGTPDATAAHEAQDVHSADAAPERSAADPVIRIHDEGIRPDPAGDHPYDRLQASDDGARQHFSVLDDPVAPGHGGPGWERLPDDPVDPNAVPHGDVLPQHGAVRPSTDPIVPKTDSLRADPQAPWGRLPDGTPMGQAQWAERFLEPGGFHMPPNAGALPGTRARITDLQVYLDQFGQQMDRVGGSWGTYLSPMIDHTPFTFEGRGITPLSLTGEYRSYLVNADRLPEGWSIEVGRVAPAYGLRGGGVQALFFKGEDELSVQDLLDAKFLE